MTTTQARPEKASTTLLDSDGRRAVSLVLTQRGTCAVLPVSGSVPALYRIVEDLLVLWPLLTPVGSFFNILGAGDIALPWASIAGFANVLAGMAFVVWLAARREQAATRGGLP